MKVANWLPEGESGDYRVERFTVTEKEARFETLRAVIGSSARPITAGTYTRLMRRNTVVMSDTPAEIRDHFEAVRQLSRPGKNFIAGLGLGMVAAAVLERNTECTLTIVEISPDVINLVGSHLQKRFPGRIEIIEANIMNHTPPKDERYTAAWFDIWDYLCGDNLPAMKTLTRRYGRRADWKGCWGRELIGARK